MSFFRQKNDCTCMFFCVIIIHIGSILKKKKPKKKQLHHPQIYPFSDIAEEFLKEFTIAYNTAYGVEYTKKTLKEIDADSFAEEKPVYKLSHRPVSTGKYGSVATQGRIQDFF